MLKHWHFQLIPKYNFAFFLDRCQAAGSTKLINAYIDRVRKIHKGEDNWDVIEGNPNLFAEPSGEQFKPRDSAVMSQRANSVFNDRLSSKSVDDLFRKMGNEERKAP